MALPEAEFPTVGALADRWAGEDAEMRSWLQSLDDPAMEVIPARPARVDS